MKYRIFTYGTLMKGEINHHFLDGSKYLCDGVLEDYGLKETGSYPAAIPMKGFRVYGEIYEVDEDTKKAVDMLEDAGHLYVCNKACVDTDEGKQDVLFYEYLLDTADMKTRIPYGKWNTCRKNMDDYVWYAVYGSNLLSRRFNVYLAATSSKAAPVAEEKYRFRHPIYFAKRAKERWENKGVAFLDTGRSGEAYGYRYLVSKDQYETIKELEGKAWYDDDHFLEKDAIGLDIRTITASVRYEEVDPSQEYLDIIAAGLIEKGLVSDVKEAADYFHAEEKIDVSKEKIDMIMKRFQ